MGSGENNELVLLSEGIPCAEELSEDEEMIIQVKLWQLLAVRTQRYTMGDHSSIRIETARELLRSICFCINLYLKETGEPVSYLLNADFNELFGLALQSIEKKIETGKRLYQAACLTAPEVENTSYRDTLRGMKKFWKCYDFYFFAHLIPCDIDYQLSNPVPDSLLGIEYFNDYLRRIIIENNLLRRFETGTVIRLLCSYCTDYEGLLINLYEPVATNAIGLAMIGGDVYKLDIRENDRSQIAAKLIPLSEDKALASLRAAVACLCGEWGIGGSTAADYLQKTSESLYPRIKTAMNHSGLGGIFLSLPGTS